MLRRLATFATTLLLGVVLMAGAASAAPWADDSKDSGNSSDNQPGDFDFYVLSLSWSPSYCEMKGRHANRQECGGRPFSFVVHGLWPQNEQGYPSDCQFDEMRSRGSFVPRQIVSSVLDIMPSTGSVVHEWRKHGSCSGLSQSDYFDTVRRAYRQVTIPPSLRNPAGDRRVDPVLVEKAFIAANPGMKPDGVSVTCQRNYLQEVRICMTKDLQYRSCDQVDNNSCRSRSIAMPAP